MDVVALEGDGLSCVLQKPLCDNRFCLQLHPRVFLKVRLLGVGFKTARGAVLRAVVKGVFQRPDEVVPDGSFFPGDALLQELPQAQEGAGPSGYQNKVEFGLVFGPCGDSLEHGAENFFDDVLQLLLGQEGFVVAWGLQRSSR